MMNHRNISLTFLAVLLTTMGAQAQMLQVQPRLVVAITIDQLRSDYLEAFTPLYGADGFKKLMEKGLVCTNASYPFSPIDRASAIASLSTGTTPYYNSIVGKRWLNRETLRPVYCVEDATQTGYLTNERTSPANLCVSTIGDELKIATQGKAIVYAIAPFSDEAILSAGHAADGAAWIDDNTGRWCSSNYYKRNSSSWLHAVSSIMSPASMVDDMVWDAVNQLSGNFSFFMSGGMQKPFKHKFTGDRKFFSYKTSALINEHITDISLRCINGTGMGIDNFADLLSVTYYAGNFENKPATECQMEIQDTYVRLDREIARLIAKVEQTVGEGKTLYLITSTGYCNEDCHDYSAYRVPGGTFSITRTANLLNMYMGAIWGQGSYVEASFGSQIYLNHKFLEQKRISITDATQRAQELVSQLSGVRSVYTALQLQTNVQEQTYKVRNGFYPERNGDIIIEVAPGWTLHNEDTQEKQISRLSYIPFPIIIYGCGIKGTRLATPVSVTQIAPTIAKSIRIRAPNACVAEPLF